MKTRVITAIVALIIFFPVLYFASTAVFPIAIGVLAAVAGYELASCAGFGGLKFWYINLPAAAYCFVVTVCARIKDMFPGAVPQNAHVYTLVFVASAAFVFYIMCVSVFAFGKVKASRLMATVAMSFFAAAAFYSFVKVRDYAVYDYLLILIAAWMTDTFAIFGGKLFGKKKLCPNLSPKKTVAGMISGIVGAVVGFAVYGLVMDLAFGSDINYVLRMALAVPASLIAQLGDLSASALKRDFGVKDYGKLFPGHGGVMDRFDSVMFLSLATLLFIFAARYFFPGLV